MEKEIKIQVPEGYEIDKKKSTFEKIVFKKKESTVNCWEDIKSIDGIYIDAYSGINECVGGLNASYHHNVFLNEKYAKSALALAQISQLFPYYDANVDWSTDGIKYSIISESNKIVIVASWRNKQVLSFNSRKEAERFLKYNEQLVKDYFMID